MPRHSSLHDLKTLIRSFHPLVIADTVEEGRLAEMLDSAARELRMPGYEWSCSSGLARRPDGNGIATTAEPAKLIAHLMYLEKEAIYHLKDFHPHLRDADLVRRFRELCQKFAGHTSTVFLSGVEITLPAEIEHFAVRFEVALPSRKELSALLGDIARDIRRRTSVRIALERSDLDAFLDALRGLTLEQARRVIAYAIIEDGRLDARDVEVARRRKAAAIRESGLLDFAIHLRQRKQDVTRFDLGRLAEATAGFSGAETEQVVVGGLYRALHQGVELGDEILLREVQSTVPLSISRREDIARLRETARERFVPVSAAPAHGG